MSEQRMWACRCWMEMGDGVVWGRMHREGENRCVNCGMQSPWSEFTVVEISQVSDIPESACGVPVEVGEVPDMGAPVFGPFAAAEDRVVRRLAEGFPRAQYADTTGLQDHPLMKRIERKG